MTYDFISTDYSEHITLPTDELNKLGGGSVISFKGKQFKRVLPTTQEYAEKGNANNKIEINSIAYLLEYKRPLAAEIVIGGTTYCYVRTVAGVPSVADFSDTFRHLHDPKTRIKTSKPPLEVESSSWGYGLT